MIVVFFAVGLFAGMVRKMGWIAIPFAAVMPLLLWLTDISFVDSGITRVLVSCVLWAAATGAGAVVSLLAQETVTNDWVNAQR